MTYPGNLVDPDELYANVSESVFQQDIITEARRLGYEAYSHNSGGTYCLCGVYVRAGQIITSDGWPDLCIGREDPPRLIIVELKHKGKYLDQAQKKWRAIMEANGMCYHLWRPADWDKIVEILKAESCGAICGHQPKERT